MTVDSQVKIEIDRDLYADVLGVTLALKQILSELSSKRLYDEEIEGVAAAEVKRVEQRLRDAAKLAAVKEAECRLSLR